MGEYSYDPRTYEERYRKVYESGAEFWEEPVATEAFVDFIQGFNLPEGSRAVDMGCGEGMDSIFLAKMGFNVTAIDASRSAIKRARKWAKREKLAIDFLVADFAYLPIRDGIYNLSINIACLQMIIDQNSRDRHLREAFRVLKRGGIYFSCNLRFDVSMSIEDFYKKLGKTPGDLIPRKIMVLGEEREIYLPIIAAWPKSKEQYLEEFRYAGFNILKAYRDTAKPVGSCWILIATRPNNASAGSTETVNRPKLTY